MKRKIMQAIGWVLVSLEFAGIGLMIVIGMAMYGA